ncbi:MAG: 3-keto-5-aminohexanoate cleavage protein [Polyangiaceae bacterium]|nr:3-keto-5-aminohexanoate cleavage protein [Polyangiaceae bacterium]
MSTGVGLTVTLRVRMGAHDAHYAGELVDGARMLGLFGDVATELLIRLDGDEGLFRAYEAIEFLAPVRAGDFIEATGIITKVGQTSRVMAFEARKVVSNVREPGAAASAADALSDPVVVCRAIGTCVVPKDLQRRPRLVLPALSAPPPETAKLPEPRPIITPPPRVIVTPPSSELILTAAIVGAEVTREQTPYLPITAREIADEAARCRDAGAAVIHLHVRRPDGAPSQARELFAEAIAAIREKTDVIVQTSTGGAVGMSGEERAQPLLCRPEMATLNCGTINFGDEVFENPRPLIRDLARRIREAGSVPELECYEVGHVDEALALLAQGHLLEPLHFQFVLGVPGGIGAREDVLRFLISQVPPRATWAVAAVGRHQRPMTELAMRLGGHARVGLEDNIFLEKGVLAEGSAPLVARAAAYARSVGREVVDPARARQILGISGAAAPAA